MNVKDKLKRFLGLESWEEKLYRLPVPMKTDEHSEIVTIIETFLDNTAGPYDWDWMMTGPKQSQEAELISAFCACLDFVYPPDEKGSFCSQEGEAKLKELLAILKNPDRESSELSRFLDSERQKAEQSN